VGNQKFRTAGDKDNAQHRPSIVSRFRLSPIRTFFLFHCTLLVMGVGAEAAGQDLWNRDKLTGTWGGLRTTLEDKGIEVEATYTGESLGVPSGGLRQGITYEGLLDVAVEADLEALAGWTGGKAQVRAFQIHDGGRNAAELVGSLADPSSIDGRPSTRLYTAWLQQDFGDSGSLRVGQLAADDQFFVSTTAGNLINGTFGWPVLLSANLPSSGPAYPLAAPGLRLRFDPSDTVSVIAAVFSGNPAGKNCDTEPQACNDSGTTFSRSNGAFWIGEAQYQMNQGKDAEGLATAYKIGAWHHDGAFADQRFGLDPSGAVVSLAATPAPDPLHHRGDWGVYGIVDQMLWRNREQSASVFLRGGVSPSDRNLVAWYVDGGIGFNGIVPTRPDDTLTFGVAYSSISGDASDLDRDMAATGSAAHPIRSAEAVFELSYIVKIAPWWTIQPDVQYVINPGGKSPDPGDPTRAVENAIVIGARMTFDL
jgi:porin